ncbi:MAG: class I SAM-dependent methyltransferase [Pseudomonadota bacterium]
MTETLYDIGARHGTDKAGQRQLLWIYDRVLAPYRQADLTVLEIGVLDGASLRMWRDYFPNGRIYGIDIDPATSVHAGDRIGVFNGAQSDCAFLDRVLDAIGGVDLVVDDGSHLARDQIGTLLHLWPRVRADGTYIVEDTHTSYLPDYHMRWREPGTTMEFLKGVADDVHWHWHDRPVLVRDCESISFFSGSCVMRKHRVLS